MAMNTPSTGQDRFGAGGGVVQADAGDDLRRAAADDLLHRAVPDDVDLGMGEQPVLQDFFGAQAVAAMDQRHFVGVVGQVQRFLHRRVAAADHGNGLAAIEEAVAGGAGGDAAALQGLFRVEAKPAGLRAGGDDDGVGGVDVAGVALATERSRREIDAR